MQKRNSNPNLNLTITWSPRLCVANNGETWQIYTTGILWHESLCRSDFASVSLKAKGTWWQCRNFADLNSLWIFSNTLICKSDKPSLWENRQKSKLDAFIQDSQPCAGGGGKRSKSLGFFFWGSWMSTVKISFWSKYISGSQREWKSRQSFRKRTEWSSAQDLSDESDPLRTERLWSVSVSACRL